MSSDTASEVKFEIGHVLFIDIVGYSKLLITQQSEQIETLREDRARNRRSSARPKRRETAAIAHW